MQGFVSGLVLWLVMSSKTVLLGLPQSQVLDEQREFRQGSASPKDLLLFRDYSNFAHHTVDLFIDIEPDLMKILIAHVRYSKPSWLFEFSRELTSADVKELFSTHSKDMLQVCIPLFNEGEYGLLEALEPKDFAKLEEINTTGVGELFNPNRVTNILHARQRYLAPHLPPKLQTYLKDVVLKEFVASDRCDLLTTMIFENLRPTLAPLLSGGCVRKLKLVAEPLEISKEMALMLPEDVFENFPATNLSPATYKALSEIQLANHLRLASPSPRHLQSLDVKFLRKVLAIVVNSPENAFKVGPELIAVTPVSAMRIFGRAFWANANPDFYWRLTSAQLLALPIDALDEANPKILSEINVKMTSSAHSMADKLAILVSRMGRYGRDDGVHSCKLPVGILKIIHPSLTSRLTFSCIENMEPIAMRSFIQSAHLNSLTSRAVETLKAYHIAEIPAEALNDNAHEFLEKLFISGRRKFNSDDPAYVACSGLQVEHVRGWKSPRTWRLVNYECLSTLSNKVLSAIPPEGYSNIPTAVFEQLPLPIDDEISGIETVALILERIGESQFEALGQKITKDSIHPCNQVLISWTMLGGKSHSKVAIKIPPICFSLLNVDSYRELPKGAISRMHDEILKYVKTPERLAAIPAVALYGIRAKQIEHLQLDALYGMKGEQLLVLGQSLMAKALKPKQVAMLPLETFVAGLDGKIQLAEDVLAFFDNTHFIDSSWIASHGEALSSKQWQLAASAIVDVVKVHPCAYIKHEHVYLAPSGSKINRTANKSKTFWKGISPQCLAALNFFDDLESQEIALMSDSAFRGLPASRESKLEIKLGSNRERLKYGRSCSNYTVESFAELSREDLELLSSHCYAELSKAVLQDLTPQQTRILPAHAFYQLRWNQLAAISNQILGSLEEAQWASLAASVIGISCSGFTAGQTLALPMEKISAACIGYLEPEVFSKLSYHQFQRVPLTAWRETITRDQVSMLPPDLIADFQYFNHLGTNFNQAETLHPCLGVTHEQQRLMTRAAAVSFEKSCGRIIRAHLPRGLGQFYTLVLIFGTVLLFFIFAILVSYYFYWRRKKIYSNSS